jgi:hypothetical protein
MPRTTPVSTDKKSSSTESWTRIRERAQQSCPALPKTAHGGRLRGGLQVRVGEHEVGRLAAQLEGHALDRLRRSGGDRAADLGRAGERDLGDVRVLDEPRAADTPRSGKDVHHALGDAGLERQRSNSSADERRELGRLEHDRVPRRQARPSFHEAIVSGKFHGVISATTPSGSRNVIATRRDRDRVAEQPLDAPA